MPRDTMYIAGAAAYVLSVFAVPIVQTEQVGKHYVWRTLDTTEVSPAADGIGTLVDNNGDNVPDRKYISAGGGVHGTLRKDFPITDKDVILFKTIMKAWNNQHGN